MSRVLPETSGLVNDLNNPSSVEIVRFIVLISVKCMQPGRIKAKIKLFGPKLVDDRLSFSVDKQSFF